MEECWKPKIGMEFESIEEAWDFWRVYGGRMGFGVRKDTYVKSRKDKNVFTSIKYVCSKEGFREPDKRDVNTKNPRDETRTGCQVKLHLKLVGTKYKVHKFHDDHNHELHTKETSHMLRSQRKITEVQAHEIEVAEDSGLRQKTSFDLMSLHMGGRANIGYTRQDVKNYLKSRRQRNMVYGEAGALLQHFQNQLIENPSFFNAYQMDSDEQITNVFWADARMLVDYGLFGDVVSLDTTFGTNKNNRPLALFCGFNHYRGMIIFGVALMYDETVESFIWLFETFLESHHHKKPLTVFTDQDVAMAKALSEVMPDSVHGLCTWHLMRNATKHLGRVQNGEKNILRKLSQCIYEIDDEDQFEVEWCRMLLEHNVRDNRWLKTTYEIKEKWAACYMKKAFTLGMRSTQLSESLNSNLKDLLNPKLDLVQFFKHFERIVDEKRYNELKCEFDCREKVPRLRNPMSTTLRQMSTIYTPTIFELFQTEYEKILGMGIKEKHESVPVFQYVVSLINGGRDYMVSFDPSSSIITCSCYMKRAFTLGMRSTQLSESLNSNLKDLLNPKLDLVQFFKHFERIVDEKRYNELKCEFDCREKVPRLRNPMSTTLRQMSTIYTPTIFELFQTEYEKILGMGIKEKHESVPVFQYVVSLINGGRDYMVSFDPSSSIITCSCLKFENIGILCSHALKVYDCNEVHLVPDLYIMPRWTRKARAGIICDIKGKEIDEDPRQVSRNRFREVSRDLISLAAEASRSEEAYSFLQRVITDARKHICELHSMGKGLDSVANATTVPTFELASQAAGFKKKEGANNKNRYKSCVEIRGKKKRRVTTKVNQALAGVSCSAPPAPPAHVSEMSFTDMLMASIDQSLLSLDTLQFGPHL